MSAAGKYWLLDDVAGWRGELSGLSVSGPERDLTADALPGFAEELPQTAVECPGAMAVSRCGNQLYMIDERDLRIKILEFDGSAKARTLPGAGGEGDTPRHFRRPRGLALLSDGRIAVADTGNHRLQIFTPFPHALTAVWTGYSRPWGLAAGICGTLYVADRGKSRVVKLNIEGTIETEITGFQSPSALAISSSGALAVVDGGTLLIATEGWSYQVPNLTSVTFDDGDYLYAGTSEGLVYKFARDPKNLFRLMGIGVLGRSGGITQLTWMRGLGLIAVVSDVSARPVLCKIATGGSFAEHGDFLSDALDSELEQCSWHRVQIRGNAPDGTSIRVETQTAAADTWTSDKLPFVPNGKEIVLTGKNPECLIHSAPGRYLRFRLHFTTNGITSPIVHSIKTIYPRESYLQYLPAVYQEDLESRAFLDRFLSIFQTSFDGFDGQIDEMWRYFEPAAVPSDWFVWLAAWIALPINPLWTDIQRRNVLKKAFAAYQRRGTPDGLQQVVLDYTGTEISILEHFRLRRLTVLSAENRNLLCAGLRLWSRDFYGRLQVSVYSRLGYFRLTGSPEPGLEPVVWGANKFTVLFFADPYSADETLKSVIQIVEREKPAHTEASYCPVYPRFRVGVQSTLGVDARIGAITHIVLRKAGKLGYDSVLACSRTATGVRSFGGALPARTGINSKLM